VISSCVQGRGLVAVAAGCLFSALVLWGCTTTTIQKAQSKSVYDCVIERGTIRCGYCIYNPGCLKEPSTGKLTGIGVDSIEMVAKNLGLKVEWKEEVGWGTMIEGLETNRYDMIATPVWATSDRAKVVDFSRPLYFSPVCAYVKAGNKTFNSGDLKKLDSPKYSIASIDGATAEIIAQEDFPNVRRVSLPQLSDFGQLLLTVSSGKADITFTEPADAAVFMKNNPGAIERIGAPVRVFPNCWIFRRGQLEFKDMINTALDQLINSGAEERLIEKYEPLPNALYRVAVPYEHHRVPSKG
jgi:ABC-type amino acid transport substrate-binding protein